VTIIIAAVVSTFAGGIMTSQEATPSASFDVSMTDKKIELVVQSASQDIPSKNIMIVLSKDGKTRKLVPGVSTVPFGFNIVERGTKGFHDNENVTRAKENPTTIGTTHAAHDNNSKQWFGNYTLKTGSRMGASHSAFIDVLAGLGIPEGFDKGSFTKGEFLGLSKEKWTSVFGETVTPGSGDKNDQTVLSIKSGQTITNSELAAFLEEKGVASNGETTENFWVKADDPNWSFGKQITYGDGCGSISVAPGDRVTVTIVYTPSGQTMFTKTVVVKGA